MVDHYRETYQRELSALMDHIDAHLETAGILDDEARMVMLISIIATEATAHKLLAGRLIDQYNEKMKHKEDTRKKERRQEDKAKDKSK